jgi:hypothetical protein
MQQSGLVKSIIHQMKVGTVAEVRKIMADIRLATN